MSREKRFYIICQLLILLIICLPFLWGNAVATDEYVGNTQRLLSNANAYCTESALGDAVADALRTETRAELAVVFCGDLDLYLIGGELTYTDVEAAIPVNSEYVMAELSLAELTGILETGLSHLTLTEAEEIDYSASECGDFPQISGFSLRCDASAPAGERILDLTLDSGETPDAERTFSVALPRTALTTEQAVEAVSCGGIRDIFLSYLAQNSPLEKPELTRIRIIGAHANPLISSGPVIMVGLIILICAVMAIPSILRREKNPEAREDMYFTGISTLRNKKKK